MLDFLAALSGVMIAIMILMNGQLSEVWGGWTASVVIHIVGSSVGLLWMLLKRDRLFAKIKMPFALYLGGVIGVVTTVCGNVTAPAIGVSATLALSLLGQTATSAVLDAFGWLGAKKAAVRRETFIGMALIAAGIAVMMLG